LRVLRTSRFRRAPRGYARSIWRSNASPITWVIWVHWATLAQTAGILSVVLYRA
jgi:hypothetical protein